MCPWVYNAPSVLHTGWETGGGRAHELEFPGSEATTSRVCLVPWLLIKNLLTAGDQGFRIKDSRQGEVTPALGPHAAPARGLRHAVKLVSVDSLMPDLFSCV